MPPEFEIPADLMAQLVANGERSRLPDYDAPPVVKLFTPDAQATWLLSDVDPIAPDYAFGLCDMGLGEPELGSVLISELRSIRGRLGLPVERDLYFRTDKPMSAWATAARRAGRIVTPT